MERQRQTLEEIVRTLSPIATTWEDDHSRAVLAAVRAIPTDSIVPTASTLTTILDGDFEAGLTALRLVLDVSKDEFTSTLRKALGPGGFGSTRYRKDREGFIRGLEAIGVLEALVSLVKTPVTWKTLLTERLKAGRGSAIKGQQRGRFLENFVEEVVKTVFGAGKYEVRCRFTGAKSGGTEKADFAIPTAEDAVVLIEVKAYGATGSKQTDILGDISRIVEEKRHDTQLFLVTDGVTWHDRLSDLRKLVEMQNQGRIARIYTSAMREALVSDLSELKRSNRL